MNKTIIDKKYLVKKDSWEAPTVSEMNYYMQELIEKHRLNPKEINDIWGVNNSTIRDWKNDYLKYPNNKARISYHNFTILAGLLDNVFIANNIEIKNDKNINELIPQKFFTNGKSFLMPPVEIIKKFVGKESITGLSKVELSIKLGWNRETIYKIIKRKKIKYDSWVFLLLSCGADLNTSLINQPQNEIITINQFIFFAESEINKDEKNRKLYEDKIKFFKKFNQEHKLK